MSDFWRRLPDLTSGLTKFWTTILPKVPDLPDISSISERFDGYFGVDDSTHDYSSEEYYEDYSTHDISSYYGDGEIAVSKEECCPGVVDLVFLGSVLGVIGFVALFLRQAMDNINAVPRMLQFMGQLQKNSINHCFSLECYP